jgi:hypothetical protein
MLDASRAEGDARRKLLTPSLRRRAAGRSMKGATRNGGPVDWWVCRPRLIAMPRLGRTRVRCGRGCGNWLRDGDASAIVAWGRYWLGKGSGSTEEAVPLQRGAVDGAQANWGAGHRRRTPPASASRWTQPLASSGTKIIKNRRNRRRKFFRLLPGRCS